MLARCVQKRSAAWGWGERESAIIAPFDGNLAQTRSFMMTSIRIGGSKATQTCAEDAKKMKPSAAVERMRQPKQKAVARVGSRAPATHSKVVLNVSPRLVARSERSCALRFT